MTASHITERYVDTTPEGWRWRGIRWSEVDPSHVVKEGSPQTLTENFSRFDLSGFKAVHHPVTYFPLLYSHALVTEDAVYLHPETDADRKLVESLLTELYGKDVVRELEVKDEVVEEPNAE